MVNYGKLNKDILTATMKKLDNKKADDFTGIQDGGNVLVCYNLFAVYSVHNGFFPFDADKVFPTKYDALKRFFEMDPLELQPLTLTSTILELDALHGRKKRQAQVFKLPGGADIRIDKKLLEYVTITSDTAFYTAGENKPVYIYDHYINETIAMLLPIHN